MEVVTESHGYMQWQNYSKLLTSRQGVACIGAILEYKCARQFISISVPCL